MRRFINWSTWAFVAAAAVGQQAPDPTVRSLEDKGVYFKLPPGWAWASEANVISIKQTFKVKDQDYEITGELVFETNKFADEQIKDIEKKVKESKGDLRDLKVQKKQKLGSQRASIATFVRARGEGKDQTLSDERVYVFKRGAGCFTWTEASSKAVSGQASAAFDAARKAFTFKASTETSVSDEREIKDVKGHYKLPDDFEWVDRADAKKGEAKAEGAVVHVYTDVEVKGATHHCQFEMYIQKIEKGYKADLSTILDNMKKNDPTKIFKEPLFDVTGVNIEKKGDISGEHCITASWVAAFEKNGPKQTFNRMEFVKANHLISWIEIVPWSKTPAPEVAEALKQARAGLSFGNG